MEYDAILRKYYISRHAGCDLIYGTIYQDKKGRFDSGTEVRTSLVVSYKYDAEGNKYAVTLNTTYKLEEPVNPE